MLPDPSATRAVLIGVDSYSDLPNLPSVANNLRRLSDLLQQPGMWGLSPASCVVLANPDSPEQTLDVIEQAAAEAADTLLVYFAGHGMIEPNTFNLHLGLANASVDRLRKALRYDDLRRVVVDATTCQAKLVILDCCFSGMAMSGAMSGVAEVADHVRIEGTCLMTAAAETAFALAPPNEEFTAFTGELISVLERGIPGGAPFLDTEAIYWHVRSELTAKGRPIPQQRSRNLGRAIVLGHNRHGRHTVIDHPAPEPQRLPELSEEYRHALRMRPRDLADLVAGCSERRKAEQILLATGARRADEEVAAIAGFLDGNPEDMAWVLAGAALRAPSDLTAIIAALKETEQSHKVPQLLHQAAHRSAADVAAVAVAVHAAFPAGGQVAILLDAAASVRIQDPQALISLVGSLWSLGMRDAVDAALGRIAERMPAAHAALVADALRNAGREEAAFRLYASATSAIQGRPQADIVELAAAMEKGGWAAPAGILLDDLAMKTRDAASMVGLVELLWSADLPDRCESALAFAATTFSDTEVFNLAVSLRERERADAAHALLLESAKGRPAATLVAFLTALRDIGWPVAANRLLEAAWTHLPPSQFQGLIALFAADPAHEPDLRRLVAGATSSEPARLAECLRGMMIGVIEGAAFGSAFAAVDLSDLLGTVKHMRTTDAGLPALLRLIAQRLNGFTGQNLFSAITSASPHGADLLVTCVVTSDLLAPECLNALTAERPIVGMPTMGDVIGALGSRPASDASGFRAKLAVISGAQMELRGTDTSLPAGIFADFVNFAAEAKIDVIPMLRSFAAARSASDVDTACRGLTGELATRLVQLYGHSQAGQPSVFHLARLRSEAALPEHVEELFGAHLQDALDAVDDPIAAQVELTFNEFARAATRQRNYLGHSLSSKTQELIHQSLNIDIAHRILGVIFPGSHNAGGGCLVLTDRGIFHRAGKEKATQLTFSDLAMAQFAGYGPDVVTVSVDGKGRYAWTLIGGEVSSLDVAALLSSLKQSLDQLVTYWRTHLPKVPMRAH